MVLGVEDLLLSNGIAFRVAALTRLESGVNTLVVRLQIIARSTPYFLFVCVNNIICMLHRHGNMLESYGPSHLQMKIHCGTSHRRQCRAPLGRRQVAKMRASLHQYQDSGTGPTLRTMLASPCYW